jgi:stringent starvation protein B
MTPPTHPSDPPMKARRPYLLRAIHEWITDSMCTPHIVVDAGMAGVEVPRQFVKDGKIVLNVSWTATANLRLTNEGVSFSGRFGGASMAVTVPIAAVLAIYARETGQGMIFSDTDVDPAGPPGTSPEPPQGPSPDGPPPAPRPASPADVRRSKFKVVK